jgi:hypothetical protein
MFFRVKHASLLQQTAHYVQQSAATLGEELNAKKGSGFWEKQDISWCHPPRLERSRDLRTSPLVINKIFIQKLDDIWGATTNYRLTVFRKAGKNQLPVSATRAQLYKTVMSVIYKCS